MQSRYYSPAIGRFISADAYAMTYETPIGANMFAYCMNNPVKNMDIAGNIALTAIFAGCIVGGAIGACFGAFTAYATGQDVVSAAILGGINGAICALPVKGPALAVAAAKASAAMAVDLMQQYINDSSNIDAPGIAATGFSMFLGSATGSMMPMYLDGDTLHNLSVIIGNSVSSLNLAGLDMLVRAFMYDKPQESAVITEEASDNTGIFRIDRLK